MLPPPPQLDPAQNGVPKTEIEELQIKCNKGTDQSLESTRRMIALCEESKEAGIRTLVHLDDQGGQLDHIESGMTQIKEDMRQAEDNLKHMEKCCGLCVLPWKRGGSFKEDAATWKATDDGKVVNTQPHRVMDGQIPAYGGYIGKITNDAREDEMERNMGQVSTMLGNLKNMGIDMESEIESQNRQLVHISDQAESNIGRISSANKRTEELLHK